MTKLIIKTDDGVSVLYLEYENNTCNYYGFKICDEKITPLPEDAIKILDIFKLGLNRKALGIEDGYEVILDCNTNFKHYFKNKNEDFDKFILMNSEDLTVYEDDKNNEKNNNEYFRKFILVLSDFAKILVSRNFAKGFTEGVVIGTAIAIGITPLLVLGRVNRFKYIYNREMSESLAYSSLDFQKDDIVNYIMNSSNLNEQEKELLINNNYLDFISPYIMEVAFNMYLNDYLNNLDIVSYTAESEPNHAQDGGFFQGDNKLHIRNYNEENPKEHIREVGHEFIHLFQNPLCSVYISEAMTAILNYEFYTNLDDSYPEEVANIKGLMEVIGPEPLIKYNFSGDFTEIENLVKVYLEEDDYNEFIRIISSNIHDKTDNERSRDNKILKALIYKMYVNKYGELDDDFIALIDNDPKNVTRYYFNPKFINQENSYYLEIKNDPIDLKTAYDMGLMNCFYTEKVLYEDDSITPELKYDKVVKQEFLYEYSEDIESAVFEGNSGYFHHATKGEMIMTIKEALDANYMKCIGYEITYSISYEESLTPEIKDGCEYLAKYGGYIENGMLYTAPMYIKHFVEPINKKFPKEEQTYGF